MLKIKYRLTDNIEMLSKINRRDIKKENFIISGFFGIYSGEQITGSYYHENLIQSGEYGGENLCYWFNNLLDVIMCFSKGGNYYAFKELEMAMKWLEFIKNGNSIEINVIVNKNVNFQEVNLNSPLEFFSKINNSDYSFYYDEFENEIIMETMKFINEISDLNKILLNTDNVVSLLTKMDTISKMHMNNS